MTALAHAAADVAVLLAAALTLACGIGVAAMRDVYQRTHFTAPPATIAPALLVLGTGLRTFELKATLEAALILLFLAMANGVVCHAIARAAFVRAHDHWPPEPDELRPPTEPGG